MCVRRAQWKRERKNPTTNFKQLQYSFFNEILKTAIQQQD